MRSTDAILAARFMPPSPALTKADPRGSEYGYFSCISLDDETIEVTKYNDARNGQYTFVISVQSFPNWASDCT